MSQQKQSVSIRTAASKRRGVSLLEVILAIAILGVALAIIGEIIRIGFRSANEAKLQSEAQILCDAKMAEVAAGVLPLESTSGASIEENQEWEYDVQVDSGDIDGLLVVRVTVRQVAAAEPVSFYVTRFMPDPDYDPNEIQ